MIDDPDALVGRRYIADFRVVRVEPGPCGDGTRRVVLRMFGADGAEISLEELSVLVESGFVMEVPEP